MDVRQIRDILDEIHLDQVRWEDDERVMTFNGEPIGATFRNAEIDRWWRALKQKLAEYLADKL